MTPDEQRAWDAFAAAALVGLVGQVPATLADANERAEYARTAAEVADALLAERRKRATGPTE